MSILSPFSTRLGVQDGLLHKARPLKVYPKDKITGIVLAGGRARRMGGLDKGLMAFADRSMVSHIAAILRPQVDSLIINANRNTEIYRCMGHTVVPDTVGDFLGPLAGMASGMRIAKTPYVVTVPCDSPFIPPNLVERLYAGLETTRAEVSVAHDGDRPQPVFAMLRSALWESIMDFLAAGDRKILLWYDRHRTTWVDFSDRPEMFLNVNTPEDKAALGERIARNQTHTPEPGL